jgi:Ca2+-binding EF-hand superfamily protein
MPTPSDPLGRVEKLYDDYQEYEAYMRAAFEVFLSFDENKNGALDTAEFTAFLNHCGLTEGVQVPLSEFSESVCTS